MIFQKYEKGEIYNCDNMEILHTIKDKSIALVLTDPPYNISKEYWDKIQNYVEWLGLRIKQCERVLKQNGSFYFFHNDMVQLKDIMTWIEKNTELKLRSFIIWDKGEFRAVGWKNPSEKSNLRCWFPTCEYILFYTFQDKPYSTTIHGAYFLSNPECFRSIKDYMLAERQKVIQHNKFDNIARFNEYINIITNTSSVVSRHHFNDSQWVFPTKEIYKKLQTTGFFRKPYEELRNEYEELRNEYEESEKYSELRNENEELKKEYEELRYTFNKNTNEIYTNVWKSKIKSQNKRYHSCEKPIDIISKIIKTSSNENDTVLDPFSGSSPVAESCIINKRKFICIEEDKDHYAYSLQRIKANLRRRYL